MPTHSKDGKIQDFGAKIGGARKDLRGSFRVADVEGMTHIERHKLVTKNMVWPTPDFEVMRAEQGYSREALAMIKMLRDAFPAEPVTRSGASEEVYAKACGIYVETLNAVKAAAEAGKTIPEISQALKSSPDIRHFIGEINVEGDVRRLRDVTPSEAFCRWTSGAMCIGHQEAVDIMIAIGDAAKGELSFDIEKLLSKNPDWPHGTDQISAYIRKESLSIRRIGFAFGIQTTLDEQNQGEWSIARSERVIDPKLKNYYSGDPYHGLVGQRFKTQEEGLSALTECIKASFAVKREKSKQKEAAILGLKPVDAPKGPVYRVGEDFRTGNKATGDSYLTDFGMRGGEFGNWVNQEERQTVLDRGYDSFRDMADVLEMQPNQVSLGGRLAIAFGARGSGGRRAGGGVACAHYEPGRTVFNLTKPHGEGCLSHEWGHALDHFMGDRCKEIGLPIKMEDGVVYLSESTLQDESLTLVSPEHHEEARRLIEIRKTMDSIWHLSEPKSREAQIQNWTKGLNRSIENMKHHTGSVSWRCGNWVDSKKSEAEKKQIQAECVAAYNNFIEDVAKGIESGKTFTKDGLLADLNSRISVVMGKRANRNMVPEDVENCCHNVDWYQRSIKRAQNLDITFSQIDNDYARTCKKIDGELKKKDAYYALRREMFARAVETVINDTLEDAGKKNPFLVSDTRSNAYPTGMERVNLQKALLPALRDYARSIPMTTPAAPSDRNFSAALPAPVPERREPMKPQVETQISLF